MTIRAEHPERYATLEDILAQMQAIVIAVFDLVVAEAAVRLRRDFCLRLPYAIIWATTQVNEVRLITRNTKDFISDWDGIRVLYIHP